MIDKNPRTYNEIIKLKRCYELASHFTNITENIFGEMYEFLEHCEEHSIVATRNKLSFVDGARKNCKNFCC